MRRLSSLSVPIALLLLPACQERGPVAVATGPTASATPSATATTGPTGETGEPSASPSAVPRPIPPAWAAPIAEDLEPGALPDDALVPAGATLTDRIELPFGGGVPDQVAVAYALGEDPFAAEHGFAVWQRFPQPPAWSVVFAFVDAPEEGVLGISLEGGDLTGDGHDEVLVFESTGGTGACGRWTVVSGTAEESARIFRRRTCDAELAIRDGSLDLREAVYGPDDPHCCPSAFHTVTLEWNGERFVETDEAIEEA